MVVFLFSALDRQCHNRWMISKSVVACFTANFLPGGKALLAGMRRFHPEVKRYAIVLPEEVEQTRAALGDLAEVMPLPRKIKGVPDDKQMSTARLFAVKLPEDVVAYVDADACVCRPLPELWDVPAGKVNVVRDVSIRVLDNVKPDLRTHFAAQFPEIAKAGGFNSGLFALAPREWSDLPEQFEAVLAKGNYPRYSSDQPFLNALMHARAHWLPFAFNAHNVFENAIPADARIVHYTASLKPWMPGFPKHEPSYYYWERYGLMNEHAGRLLWLRLNSGVQMPIRALWRKLRRRAATG